MRFDKFTIKSQEVIQNAHSTASSNYNQQIEPEHLLSAMLSEHEGIARSMLSKIGASADAVAKEVALSIERLPKVKG
ncbi:MAG: chaperone protein ClpB, partial [Desulfobacteraceae bacterium]